MAVVVRLEEQKLDAEQELDALIGQAAGDGAVVSFVGLARAQAKCGETVDRLILEHHSRLTEQSLEEIAVAAAQRFDINQVRIVHRFGEIRPGEAIVFAGATSSHRRAAFDAADYLMDRLKTEAILWKREEGPAGSQWVEPRDVDYADRERWG